MKPVDLICVGHRDACRKAGLGRIIRIIIGVARENDGRERFALDVDALRIVSEGVNRVKASGEVGVLLITHYTRILRYIQPDFVHVFVDGRIAEEGGPELAGRLEDEGYDRFLAGV